MHCEHSSARSTGWKTFIPFPQLSIEFTHAIPEGRLRETEEKKNARTRQNTRKKEHWDTNDVPTATLNYLLASSGRGALDTLCVSVTEFLLQRITAEGSKSALIMDSTWSREPESETTFLIHTDDIFLFKP